MKAEELRIGNHIGQGEVMEIKENVVRVKYTADKERTSLIRYEDIQPIPLSEEAILKCGFEANEKYYHSKYIQDSIKIIYDFDQRILYFKYKGEFSPMIQIPIDIEYLHELQNLTYSLTGEELEVSI